MPSLFYEIWLPIFGLILGSFSNVVVLRDDRRASILTGRSECPHCNHLLRWYELIPVFSFLLQGGRCRNCHKGISLQYPVVELLSGFLWWLAGYYALILHGSLLAAILLGLCLSILLVISLIDIRSQMVALEYCLAAGLLGAAAQLAMGVPWLSIGLGGVAGGGILGLVLLGWRRLTGQDGMGEGDVWIATSLGLASGWPMIAVVLLLAVFLGAIFGGGYAVATKKGFKIRIPFGPFLTLGFIISLFVGQSWLNWYILQLQ